ncbi:MAG TPA: hypothetical protein VN137_11855 [Sphingomonas sp.]|nr:hypothetical protein [Sphingomonas sp.]
MPDGILVLEDFAPHVGTAFTLPGSEESVPIDFTLTEATALSNRAYPGQVRTPFQLIFQVATQSVYPQGLYRLTHPAMGERDIFLVPVGRTDAGVDYCATFN